jgi:hypothetical protein
MRIFTATRISVPFMSSLLIALFPITGHTVDLLFIPRIEAGVMDYEYKFGGSGGALDYKVSSNMPMANVGLTTFLDSFFIDVYLQKAFSGSDKFREDLPHDGVEGSYSVDSYFDREEYSLSLGYQLGKSWAVFAGYRNSNTSFSTLKTIESTHPSDPDVTSFRRLLEDNDFIQDGYYLGAAYARLIGAQSSISFNLALAFLDGKLDSLGRVSDSATSPDHESEGGSPSTYRLRFDGSTEGLNLGIAWKGRISSALSYGLSVNGYSYEFNGSTKSSDPEGGGGLGVNPSETVVRLLAGLSYEF